MFCLFCVVLYIVCVYMCTELLPPGGYLIAVKYIIPIFITEDIHAIGGIRTINPSKPASATQALDRAVTGIGSVFKWPIKKAHLTWYKLLLYRDMIGIWDIVT
jgi:hypothetical protein